MEREVSLCLGCLMSGLMDDVLIIGDFEGLQCGCEYIVQEGYLVRSGIVMAFLRAMESMRSTMHARRSQCDFTPHPDAPLTALRSTVLQCRALGIKSAKALQEGNAFSNPAVLRFQRFDLTLSIFPFLVLRRLRIC